MEQKSKFTPENRQKEVDLAHQIKLVDNKTELASDPWYSQKPVYQNTKRKEEKERTSTRGIDH